MYIVCNVCGTSDNFGEILHSTKNCCKKCEHIVDKFDELNKELRDSNNKLERIRDAVLFILSSVNKPLLENEPKIEIESQKILDLWDAAELRWYNAKTVKYYLGQHSLELMVICAAFKLFRKKDSSGMAHNTLLQKLENLYTACNELRTFNGWENNFNLEPKDIK